MRTAFYEHTAYKLSDQPVPNCFLMLSEQFEEQARVDFSVSTHPYALMAESICARMADIEYTVLKWAS